MKISRSILRTACLLLVVFTTACQSVLALIQPTPTLPPTLVFDFSIPTETATPVTPVVLATSLPSETPGPTTTRVPTSILEALTPTPPLIGIMGFPPGVNPLTGLAVDNPYFLERLPVFIKVSNFPRGSRPQAGLSSADIVFEYFIGAGQNRFMGVYYGQNPVKVGPVRSGRMVDGQLVRMYKGILSYGNADEDVDKVILGRLNENAFSFNNTPCPPMCGQDTHDTEGVFTDPAFMTAYAARIGVEQVKPDLKGMVFNPNPPTGDRPAEQIGVQYAPDDRGEWRFDAETGKYKRWIERGLSVTDKEMVPLTDRLNGEQLAFDNVIVLFAKYIEYTPVVHDIEIWDTDIIKGQKALFFRNGVEIEGTWRAPSHDHPFLFTDKKGISYPLKPGNSWIVIVGNASTVTQPAQNRWEIEFQLP